MRGWQKGAKAPFCCENINISLSNDDILCRIHALEMTGFFIKIEMDFESVQGGCRDECTENREFFFYW